MKILKTLINLHKSSINELNVKINQLLEEIKKLEKEKIELVEKITREKELNSEVLFSSFAAAFLKNAEKHKILLNKKIQELEEELQQLNVKLYDAFSEKKKFEILMDDKKNLILKERGLKEAEVISENVIINYNYVKNNADEH